MTEVIIISVLTGVFSAWLVTLIQSVMNRIVIPWYLAKRFDGFEVAGEWQGSVVEGDVKYSFRLSVEQRGHALSGTLTTIDSYTDRTSTRTFNIEGEILLSHVILKYRPAIRRAWGGGVFLFQVFDGGDTLRGVQSYIKTTSGKVQAKDGVTLSRKR